ncbi:6918_t:CDS:2 [Paraglomus occultum]|uniref:6918_t:CDS:1 n=1 Tax=Paraglomus occultum TaxID=144539 RepID=A0A9N9FX39_9GLOM|nr:6918_t:CDS:2 [Paraglomus occultum]
MASEFTLYKRPGYGDEGRTGSRDRQTKVLANMFEVEANDMTFYQYAIEFKRYTPKREGSPAQLAPVMRRHYRHIFTAFHKQHKEVYFEGVDGVAFDGDSKLFTTGKLTLDNNNQIGKVFEVEHDGDYYVRIKENTAKPTVSMDDLEGVLTGNSFESDCNNQMLGALDAFLQYNPSLRLVCFFRNCLYMPETIRLLGKGAALLQGYRLHVRPGEGDGRGRKLFMNVYVTYTPIVEPTDLCTLICKFLDTQTLPNLFRNDIMKRVNSAFQHNFRYIDFKLLHRPESHIVTTIKKLHDKPATEIKFFNSQLGKEESIKDYFAHKHNINLSTPYVVESRRFTCLPIECLGVVEGQRYPYCKNLNGNQHAEISRITAKHPAENVQFMLNVVRDLLSFSNELLQQAGIRLNTQIANVPGRFISIPVVSYSASSKQGAQVKPKDLDATWNLRDVKYLQPGNALREWLAISLTQAVSPGNINLFMNNLVRQAKTQGMDIASDFMPPKYVQWQAEQIREKIIEAVEDAKKEAKNLQLVVFFIDHGKHHMNKKQYNLVKEVMDTQIGILSQCIQSQLVKRCKTHYLADITAKLNLKLNGTNSAVDLPQIDSERTMVMGADVTHPSPGSHSPSIAAVVGSIDRHAARYAERHKEQFTREEIYDMEELTYQLLHEFIRTNKEPPASIVMYRDGISESEFQRVALDKELPCIKKACARLNSEYKPKISYIVVTKRHVGRFYPIDELDVGTRGNVKPGLVVERVITHPYLFNFYLTSHSSTQGTSRPRLYHVLYDENQFEVDELQDFTNKLCYNFQRASRAVAVPAPAYYAHCAAKRARSHFLDGQFRMTNSEFAQKYPMYYV